MSPCGTNDKYAGADLGSFKKQLDTDSKLAISRDNLTEADKIYNEWLSTCPFKIKSHKDPSGDGTIEYEPEHDRKYTDLMNEIYGRLLTYKSLGVNIEDVERDSSLIDALNAKIKERQRYTFSVLSKLLIIACFVILFLATIIINNQKLYHITFFIVLLTVVLNLTVMQNNI